MMHMQKPPPSDNESVPGGPTTPALMGDIVRHIMVPQGFTLSVAGTLATMICQRTDITPFAIWLFVVGSGCSYGLITVGSRAGAEPTTNPAERAHIVNLTPIIVVPITTMSARLIHYTPAAFACAGFVTVLVYVGVLSSFLRLTYRVGRTARTMPSDRTP